MSGRRKVIDNRCQTREEDGFSLAFLIFLLFHFFKWRQTEKKIMKGKEMGGGPLINE